MGASAQCRVTCQGEALVKTRFADIDTIAPALIELEENAPKEQPSPETEFYRGRKFRKHAKMEAQ